MTLGSAMNRPTTRRSRSSSVPAAEQQTADSNDPAPPVFGQPAYYVNLGSDGAPESGESSTDGPEAAHPGGVKCAYISDAAKTCKKTSVVGSPFCDRHRCPGAQGTCTNAKSSGAAFCPEHTTT